MAIGQWAIGRWAQSRGLYNFEIFADFKPAKWHLSGV
jgi:hypothetical protein